MTRARSSTTGDAQAAAAAPPAPAENMPSIRFSAYYDPRATRPSLTFPPVSRTLPSGGEVIRVGRYSERDNQPNVPNNTPSAAPVGFKSKVVSRRHCEFWYDDGKWYIKDVKSSSGTFLNHIRLSPPGTESKPFPVNDGDIVQLGIDFKGGEEMIFRCVKMRLELNRGWQNKLNTFNMATHKRLRNMTAANSANSSTQDCSICLNSIAVCSQHAPAHLHRVPTGKTNSLVAVPVFVRCAMLAHLAFQVYSLAAQLSTVPNLRLPKLPHGC